MMAIVCILNRDSHNYWLKEIVDMELFDDTIDFFYEVTYQSTRKYIAIHLMDADIDNTSKSEKHSDAIRLTVHEKKIGEIFQQFIRSGEWQGINYHNMFVRLFQMALFHSGQSLRFCN